MQQLQGKGDEPIGWAGEKFISKKERELIKEAKKEEQNYLGYVVRAVENMTPRPTTFKFKDYKGGK